VTRERIRQIESKALRKLQHHTRSIHLKGFVEAAKGGQATEAQTVAVGAETERDDQDLD